MLNEPRPGKKLLVLDIDYTLYDHRSAAETGYELMRPYLHEFLTSAYQVCILFCWWFFIITLLHLVISSRFSKYSIFLNVA